MNILALSAILALFAIGSCSASASIEVRQATVAVSVLTGYSNTGTPYPNYTVSVPENGVTIPITNPLIVYSISSQDDLFNPTPHHAQANCTFTLEDGTKAYVTYTQDIIPQKVVSVSCVAAQYEGINTSIIPPGLYPASPTALGLTSVIISSADDVGAMSSLVPPYPTATASFHVSGTTGASASAAPSATGVMTGGKSVVPFTGDASRATRSFGLFLVALLGGVVVAPL